MWRLSRAYLYSWVRGVTLALEQVPTHHSSQTDSALHALTQPNSHLEEPLQPFLVQTMQDSSDMLHDWLAECFLS